MSHCDEFINTCMMVMTQPGTGFHHQTLLLDIQRLILERDTPNLQRITATDVTPAVWWLQTDRTQ